VSFLRDKAEQLADHLRGCILRGELAEPLPLNRFADPVLWSPYVASGYGIFAE